VVAGTHGKTTTTSMLAWIYEVASRDGDGVCAFVFDRRGSRRILGSSFHGARLAPFIIEGDEYDTAFFDKGPKFMHYFPDAAILDACRVRPRGYLSRFGCGEDGVQAFGESGSAARAAGGVRRK
jgi:UDP-N-acetylmuramate-alanine ligase